MTGGRGTGAGAAPDTATGDRSSPDSHSVLFVSPMDLGGRSGGNVATKEIVAAVGRHPDLALSLVCPEPAEGLPADVAEATVETRHGEVASRWERTEDGLELAVTVPWNTSATVRVPAAEGDDIAINGDAWNGDAFSLPDGIEGTQSVADGVAFDVTAGCYRFAVE